MVSPFYDPMLAKVIAHGATREEARRRLIMALEDTVALGLKTNRSLLIAMLRHPAFAAGEATTAFIDQYFPTGGDAVRAAQPSSRMLALAAVLLFEARARSAPGDAGAAQRWSSTGVAVWPLQLRLGDAHHAVSVTAVGSERLFDCARRAKGSKSRSFIATMASSASTVSGVQQTARFAVQDDALYLDLDGDVFEARDTTLAPAGSNRSAGSLRLLAPMNGVIVNVLAKPDDPVAKGQCVVVLEAMKMQHEIVAERDGTIDKILVKPGDQVATRQLLAELKPESGRRRRRAKRRRHERQGRHHLRAHRRAHRPQAASGAGDARGNGARGKGGIRRRRRRHARAFSPAGARQGPSAVMGAGGRR